MTSHEPPSPAEPTSLPELPRREIHAHKGDAGRVAVVGGCADTRIMLGAPALSAGGAIRTGAGLVRIAAPASIVPHILSMESSAMGAPLSQDDSGAVVPHEGSKSIDELARWADSLAVGPGLGASPGAAALVLRSIQQTITPLVLDADGLNLLAELPEIHLDFHASAVLTPHPGEFARLAGALRVDPRIDDPARRIEGAVGLAQRLGCVVVLKGRGTVVTDGHKSWTCERGSPCLATGGTGDVLTGMIAALIAQHADDLSLMGCAQLAVEIHARAAEHWARDHGTDRGMRADDLLARIPHVLGELLS